MLALLLRRNYHQRRRNSLLTIIIIHLSCLARAASPPSEHVYDFIVVGSGSTGSIVGGRLAQAGYSVLLVEAGGTTLAEVGGVLVEPVWKQLREEEIQRLRRKDASKEGDERWANLSARITLPTVFDLPLEWSRIGVDPTIKRRFQWPMIEQPQPIIVRGVGGCGVHNAMIYVRGLDADFEPRSGESDSDPSHRWPSDWSFKDVLPFYRRSVHQRDPMLSIRAQYAPEYVDVGCGKSVGGEVTLASVPTRERDDLSKNLLLAFTQVRNASQYGLLPLLHDINDPARREGAGFYQFLNAEGRRDTISGRLFGVHARRELMRTLHVRTHAQAMRLLYDNATAKGELPRVNGVELAVFQPDTDALEKDSADDEVQLESQLPAPSKSSSPNPAPIGLLSVRARREVILSAGAIHTPKLLELSGIGVRSRLDALNVKMVSSLRGVGENLSDAAKILLQFRTPSLKYLPCAFDHVRGKGRPANTANADPKQRAHCQLLRTKWMRKQLQRAMDNSSGDASSCTASESFGEYGTPGFSLGVFFHSSPSVASLSNALPNLQMTIIPYDLAQRDWKTVSKDIVPEEILSVEVFINQPMSRGHVHARPPSTAHRSMDGLHVKLQPPVVHLANFEDSRDVADMVAGLRRVRAFFAEARAQGLVTDELVPGSAVQSDKELKRFVRCGPKQFKQKGQCDRSIAVTNHFSGTARISSRSVIEAARTADQPDDGSVVDSHLKVHGVQGLRVADASIMPRLPSGNTHATCQVRSTKHTSLFPSKVSLPCRSPPLLRALFCSDDRRTRCKPHP
jgi:choline dehydrogenase-like flavoprotein